MSPAGLGFADVVKRAAQHVRTVVGRCFLEFSMMVSRAAHHMSTHDGRTSLAAVCDLAHRRASRVGRDNGAPSTFDAEVGKCGLFPRDGIVLSSMGISETMQRAAAKHDAVKRSQARLCLPAATWEHVSRSPLASITLVQRHRKHVSLLIDLELHRG